MEVKGGGRQDGGLGGVSEVCVHALGLVVVWGGRGGLSEVW